MGKKTSLPRRDFLKTAAAGAGGIAVACSKANPVVLPPDENVWVNSLAINPSISNMRVVCCHDQSMIKAMPTLVTFRAQNTAIDPARVHANMDEMAKRLAAKAAAQEAWNVIFQKPAAKTWAAVKAAIKVNCIEIKNMARVAILEKLCKELAALGVLPGNIIVYDGCSSASGDNKYSPYFSLSDPSKIAAIVSDGNNSLKVNDQNRISVSIPGAIGKNFSCTAQIANGDIDILINCAVNKGHYYDEVGNCTLCMKNHFGTFHPPSDLHYDSNGFLGTHKTRAIIGGNPPRQQLCIIDSLFVSAAGPGGAFDKTPLYRLVMGTFAPAVDYGCIKNVREPLMNATHNPEVVDRMLSEFGYAPENLEWVDVAPAV